LKKLLILVVSVTLLVGVLSGCVEEETPPENVAPVAVISITQDGLTITYDASGSTDADENTLTYTWDFGDTVGTSTEATGTYTYAASGDYTVTLTANDGTVDSEAVTEDLTITNPPSAAFTYDPMVNITVNVTAVTFTDASTKGDVNISAYSWDFDGDGVEDANTSEATYTFTTIGDFDVALTVTDEDGLTDVATVTITVIEEEAV
jgi:PKD repeat protein